MQIKIGFDTVENGSARFVQLANFFPERNTLAVSIGNLHLHVTLEGSLSSKRGRGYAAGLSISSGVTMPPPAWRARSRLAFECRAPRFAALRR